MTPSSRTRGETPAASTRSAGSGKVGLVLGAGGVVGMSYHAGVLHALSEVGGFDPDAADLIVGTSAGSVVGALVATGWTTSDLWEFSQGTHPLVLDVDEVEQARRRDAVLAPRFEGPLGLTRLAIGSAYVLMRAVLRLPGPPIPRAIARHFPGGLFSMEEAEERLAEVLPESWPDRHLWLVTVDIGSGRRVVLGRSGSPEIGLRQAVQASCAIPGVYPPIGVGGYVLVDGGAHSSTNLDLASRHGCDVIIAVAPMGYDPTDPPDRLRQLVRRAPARSLQSEVRRARSAGARVLVARPGAAELEVHGRRMMRPHDTGAIATSAYDATARLLETPRARSVLERLAPSGSAAS